MSLKIFTGLVIAAIVISGLFFVASSFTVAGSKISVTIEAAPNIQEELKDELIDSAAINIIESMSGEDDKVTVIVSAIDADQVPNAITIIDNIEVAIVQGTAEEIMKLAEDPNVKYLYKDEIATIDDANIESSMYTSLRFQHTTPASSSAGAGSKVCILDTGIDDTHPWFSGKQITYKNFIDEENANVLDDNGHGTHVAGIVTSVAPAAELYIGKVCNSAGWCLFSDIMQAIEWCASNDADVISMSLGSIRYPYECDDYMISQQINRVTEENDILFTVAAGNVDCAFCEDYRVALPGCAAKAISVSAIDIVTDTIIYNPANYDMFNSVTTCDKSTGVCTKYDPGFELIDIVANGYVESAWPGGGTASLHGTSMATPHVAGSIAILKSINHDSAETIRQYLYAGAIKEGYNSNGLLNTARSCQKMLNEAPIPCDGYYSSISFGTNAKWSSSDWIKLKLNGVEKRYRKSSTSSVSINYKLNRSVDPVNDYFMKQSTFKKSEVRKINGNLFVVTKKLGGNTVYELYEFELNTEPGKYNGKKAKITKLSEVSDKSWKTTSKRMVPEKNMKFYALGECATTTTFECSKYVNEVENYIPNMKDIDFNSLELVKKAGEGSNTIKNGVAIGGSVTVD